MKTIIAHPRQESSAIRHPPAPNFPTRLGTHRHACYSPASRRGWPIPPNFSPSPMALMFQYHSPWFRGVILFVLTHGLAGCADLGWQLRWPLASTPVPDSYTAAASPAEQMAWLRKMAKDASGLSSAHREQLASQIAQTIPQEEDPMVRAEIVRTLGELPGTQADAVLASAIADPDADVRIAACRSWGKRATAQAASLLGRVLVEDANVDVRLAAANALGSIPDPQALAALGRALEDSDPAMQHRAVASLRQLTGKRFDNDVSQWQAYVKTNPPLTGDGAAISLAERLQEIF